MTRNVRYYVNPTTDSFAKRIPTKTFVDRTGFLAILAEKINNQDQKYIFISRPRGFSKGSDPNQFENLAISQNQDVCENHHQKYNVIKIDASYTIEKFNPIKPYIQRIEAGILKELTESFPNAEFNDGMFFARHVDAGAQENKRTVHFSK